MVGRDVFANRLAEIGEYRAFRTGSGCSRVLIFRGGPAVGKTSLLSHLRTLLDPYEIGVYAGCRTDDLAAIAAALKGSRDRRLWCRVGSLLDTVGAPNLLASLGFASLAGLPLIPHIAATALVGLGAGVALTANSSVTIERISRLLRTWPRPQVTFFIDDVQQRPYEMLQFVNAFAFPQEFDHVRFVLSYLEGDASMTFEDFRTRLRLPSDATTVTKIGPVDAAFVAAFWEAVGRKRELTDCERIARLARGNVWSLVEIAEGRSPDTSTKVEPLQAFILRTLLAADQPLRRSDLRLLALRSELILAADVQSVDGAIDILESGGLIGLVRLDDGDLQVSLLARSAPAVRAIAEQRTDNFVARRDVYRFYSETQGIARHSASATAGLLYRLARDLDPPAIPRLAQNLVNVAMEMGSIEDARRYIEATRPADGALSLNDLFVQIAFYVSVQEYKPAKALLDMIPRSEFDRYRVLRILEAVALNRLRSHGESDNRIDELLRENGSPDERCVLVAYKIGGLLHEERFVEAREAFTSWESALKGSRNYPYLLRTAGAVYMFGIGRDIKHAEVLLKRAAVRFRRSQDGFGLATTLCNLGVAKAYQGMAAAAAALFEQSYGALSAVGLQHVQESGTNLGTALLVSGHYEKARTHLLKLLCVMDDDFPRIIAECDLAMLETSMGLGESAKERVVRLLSIADDIRIVDASRRARLTAGIVFAAFGDQEEGESQLRSADDLGGKTDESEKIRQALGAGRLTPTTAIESYPVEYMQYWSLNPLKLLPSEALTAQAVLHDVA